MKNKLICFILILITLLPLLTKDLTLITGWVIGLAIGYVIQKSRFCFTAAYRDYFLFGSTSLLKTLIMLLMFSLIGFFIVQSAFPATDGLPPGIFKPVGLHTILGGLVFGLGMTLSGGCILISFVRLGEGFYIYLVTLFSALIGIFLAILSFPLWQSLYNKSPRVFIPNYLGNIPSLILSLLPLFIALYFITQKERSFGDLPEYIAVTSDNEQKWKPLKTAFVLGLLNTILVAIMKKPLQISNEMTHWISDLMIVKGVDPNSFTFFNKLPNSYFERPFVNWETYIILGVTVGSFISAYLGKEFRRKPIRSKKQVLLAVVSGLLMGFGARLAAGCTAGALWGGIASSSLHGWVFALFIPIGAYFGASILQKTT